MSEALDLTKRILYLRSIPVGAMLSPAVLKIIAAALVPRTWPAGTSIMRENHPVPALYLITHGGVTLRRGGAAFGKLSAPQTLGFLNIVAQTEGSYDATCDGETRAFELDADVLLDLMEDQFELLEATLRYTAERLYFDLQELPPESLGSTPEPSPIISPEPMDLVERILFLRSQSGFMHANVNAVAAACRKYTEVRYEPGHVFWKLGDASTSVLILARGTIACETATGAKFKYGPGTGVGGVDTIARKPRWYTAIAETKMQGLLGEPAGFLDLMEHDYSLASEFVASLARGLIQLIERKSRLGMQPLAQLRDVSGLGSAPIGA